MRGIHWGVRVQSAYKAAVPKRPHTRPLKAQGWQEEESRSVLYRASTAQQYVDTAKTAELDTLWAHHDKSTAHRQANRQEMYPTLRPENISPRQSEITSNTWGTKSHRNNICVTKRGGGCCSVTVQCACAYVPFLPA